MVEETSRQPDEEEQVAEKKEIRKRSGWKKKVLWTTGGILLAIAALAAGVAVLLYTPWLAQQTSRFAVDAFNRRIPATLSIRRTVLHPSENFLTLQGVTLTPEKNKREEAPITAAEIVIRYDPQAFLQKEVKITEVHIFQPMIHLVIDRAGQINLKELIIAIQQEFFQPNRASRVALENIQLTQGTLRFWDEGKTLGVQMEKIDFQGHLNIQNRSMTGILKSQMQIRSEKKLPPIQALEANLSIDKNGVTFPSLTLQGKGWHAAIEGKLVDWTIQPRWEARFSSQFSAETLGYLLPLGDLDVEGPLDVTGRLWGPLASPSADLAIAGPSK